MGKPVIEVRKISKVYRLGEIGVTSLREETERGIRKLKSIISGKKDKGSGKEDNGNEFWALREVSFDVNPGEVLGIIGKNGAGKSTLLKIISRITEPSEGEILLRGRVAALLEVGTGFHQELTGRENIYLNGTILGMKKREIDRKLDEIIDFSGIEKHIDTPVKRYSSGMNVRLGFAVAAHLEPEILIIDEVLAVGDMEFQRKCLGKMQDVAGHGRTVLFVSHNMAAINKLCSRGLLIENGEVKFAGTTAEVVDTYRGEIGHEESSRLVEENEKLKIILELADNEDSGNRRDVQIDMSYVLKVPVKTMGIGVELLSSEFNVLGRFRPVMTGSAHLVRKNSDSFKFTLENLRSTLNSGDYYLRFWFSDRGVEFLMKCQNLLKVKIDNGDVFGTGRIPSQSSDGPLSLIANVKSSH